MPYPSYSRTVEDVLQREQRGCLSTTMATKQSKHKHAVKVALAKPVAKVLEPVAATSDESVSEQLIEAKVSVTNVSIATSAANDLISLPTSCTVRDCTVLKADLLPLFDHDSVVTIDIRAVERIDTAMLQLLLAFVRDRNETHRVTKWIGNSECIYEAVGILGMTDALAIHSDGTAAVA
jgi:phospholipid transport system transporter-binding protein